MQIPEAHVWSGEYLTSSQSGIISDSFAMFSGSVGVGLGLGFGVLVTLVAVGVGLSVAVGIGVLVEGLAVRVDAGVGASSFPAEQAARKMVSRRSHLMEGFMFLSPVHLR